MNLWYEKIGLADSMVVDEFSGTAKKETGCLTYIYIEKRKRANSRCNHLVSSSPASIASSK